MLFKTIPSERVKVTHRFLSLMSFNFSRAHTMPAFYLVHFKMKLFNLDIRLFSTVKWHIKELYRHFLHFKQPVLLRRKIYNKRIQMSDISTQMSAKHGKITFRIPARSVKCYIANKAPMLKISVTHFCLAHLLTVQCFPAESDCQ